MLPIYTSTHLHIFTFVPGVELLHMQRVKKSEIQNLKSAIPNPPRVHPTSNIVHKYVGRLPVAVGRFVPSGRKILPIYTSTHLHLFTFVPGVELLHMQRVKKSEIQNLKSAIPNPPRVHPTSNIVHKYVGRLPVAVGRFVPSGRKILPIYTSPHLHIYTFSHSFRETAG